MANLRIEIKWAIYFAGMTLAWMALEKMSGLHGKYIDYHLWFMVLALQDKKKNFFHGRMSYRQGLISGILLSAFIALLSPLTQWIITYVITPDYFQTVIKRSVEIGYYPTTEAAAAQFNYKNYAINSTLFAFVFGAITTAIAMIFIQTKNEQR
jgi:hypothetical protein